MGAIFSCWINSFYIFISAYCISKAHISIQIWQFGCGTWEEVEVSLRRKALWEKLLFSIPVSSGFSLIYCLMCRRPACKWMDDAETEESHRQEKKTIKLLVKERQAGIELHYPLSARRKFTRQGWPIKNKLQTFNLLFSCELCNNHPQFQHSTLFPQHWKLLFPGLQCIPASVIILLF